MEGHELRRGVQRRRHLRRSPESEEVLTSQGGFLSVKSVSNQTSIRQV